MTDNIDNSSVSTDVVAADDVNGVKFQRVKLALGDDGNFTGDLSDQFPMPVKLNGVNVLEDIPPTAINGYYAFPQVHTHIGTSFRLVVITSTGYVGHYKIDITIQESIDGVNFRTTYMIHNADVYDGGDYIHETPILPVAGKYLRYIITTSNVEATVSVKRLATNLVVPIQRQITSKAVALSAALDLAGLMIDSQSCSKVRFVCTPTGFYLSKAKVVLYGTHDLINWFPISDSLTIQDTGLNIIEADTCGSSYIKAKVINDGNGSTNADLIIMRVS